MSQEKIKEMLQQCTQALNQVNTADLNDLKSLNNPPPIVDLTCQALMILLDVPTKDLNWTNWKKLTAKPQDLIKQMQQLDKENLKADTISAVKTLLSKEPGYSPELVAPKSQAAKSIATYILALLKYYDVSQALKTNTQPDQKQVVNQTQKKNTQQQPSQVQNAISREQSAGKQKKTRQQSQTLDEISSTNKIEHKDLQMRALRSGESIESLGKLVASEGVVGPGKYEVHKPLFGKNLFTSHTRNTPSFSIGLPRRQPVVNPETKKSIPSYHRTPSPQNYSIPADNIYFKKHKASVQYNEQKFFSPKNKEIVAQLPVQYKGQEVASPSAQSLISQHRRGSSTTDVYKQVNMGYGKRYDFTTANVEDKGDFKYDYDRMGSFKQHLLELKAKGSKNNDTFGRAFDKYQKVVVAEGLQHYYGKGSTRQIGLGPEELSKVISQTKKSPVRLPSLTADRGLLAPTRQQNELTSIGPGAYTDQTKLAFPNSKTSLSSYQQKGIGFGTSKRDNYLIKYDVRNNELVPVRQEVDSRI